MTSKREDNSVEIALNKLRGAVNQAIRAHTIADRAYIHAIQQLKP